jgi:hypothetical protein
MGCSTSRIGRRRGHRFLPWRCQLGSKTERGRTTRRTRRDAQPWGGRSQLSRPPRALLEAVAERPPPRAGGSTPAGSARGGARVSVGDSRRRGCDTRRRPLWLRRAPDIATYVQDASALSVELQAALLAAPIARRRSRSPAPRRATWLRPDRFQTSRQSATGPPGSSGTGLTPTGDDELVSATPSGPPTPSAPGMSLRRACSARGRGVRPWTSQRLPRSVAAARRAWSRSTPRRSDPASARSSRHPCGALLQADEVATSAQPTAVPADALARAPGDHAGRVRGGELRAPHLSSASW